MSLVELPLPLKLSNLLASIEGLVVDYALFETSYDGEEPSVNVLRQAARRTVERVIESGENRSPNTVIKPGTGARIDETVLRRAVPESETWEQFLGPLWNWKLQRVEQPSTSGWSGNPGYAYAFSHPPYTLRLAGNELTRAFRQVLQLLLDAPIGDASVKILRWPADWSWYFDDGHEWWGSFCWTLWRPPERIVGITASFTD